MKPSLLDSLPVLAFQLLLLVGWLLVCVVYVCGVRILPRGRGMRVVMSPSLPGLQSNILYQNREGAGRERGRGGGKASIQK